MSFWNGFYDVTKLIKKKLRSLYDEAISLGETRVDYRPEGSWSRKVHPTLSTQDFMDTHFSAENINKMVDRHEYHNGLPWQKEEGELLSFTGGEKAIYLWIVLDLDVFNDLITKYKIPRLK